MSKVAIAGNVSGTGTITVAAPNTNTDYTLTLPAETGTVLTSASSLYSDSDALDLFNVTGSAPVYACRAWVNFNGTGTVAIRTSGNVSSITDNGTGQYTVNFSTALPDANYSVGGTSSKASAESAGRVINPVEDGTFSTSAVDIHVTQQTTKVDQAVISVQIFR